MVKVLHRIVLALTLNDQKSMFVSPLQQSGLNCSLDCLSIVSPANLWFYFNCLGFALTVCG